MRVLVTSDWHLGITTHGILDGGLNSRIIDAQEVVKQIVECAVDNPVDMVVHCGDVFHTNRPDVFSQCIFLYFLGKMSEHHIKTRVIVGNHDYTSKLGNQHALTLFQRIGIPDVKIYSETDSEDIDGHLFYYFPYGSTAPDFLTRGSKSTTLVCHSHLEGAVVGAEPFEIKDDNATKWADLPVDYVFAGHFHKPQTLGSDPFAFYPGSLQPMNFSERLDKKRVCFIDLNLRNTMVTKMLHTRKLVQLDWPFIKATDVKDAIVKVNVDLDEEDLRMFNEQQVRDSLAKQGAHSIASINLNVRRKVALRNPEIKLDNDVLSNFTKYVDSQDYGELAGDVGRIGKGIIKQCSS